MYIEGGMIMAKSASEVLIERFLKEVDEKESMPWQRPYECYNAFNYFSLQPYRGFNRVFLPFGEYMTANQINTYNKEHNEDFRFQKGIKWYPVYFFKNDDKVCSAQEIKSVLGEDVKPTEDLTYLGRDGYWSYYSHNGKFIKRRSILRYYDVADRTYFKNSKGEVLPSRIESGEVEITKSEPKKVFDDYVKRTGVNLIIDYSDIPCYIPSTDTVCLNRFSKNQDFWFSTAFHELAHSTGAKKRLNREGVASNGTLGKDTSVHAVEECIAEIAAFLCCAEYRKRADSRS